MAWLGRLCSCLVVRFHLTFLLTQHVRYSDFTRLKLVKAKKEIEQKREAKQKEDEIAAGTRSAGGKENDADITAAYDASDDADVVF